MTQTMLGLSFVPDGGSSELSNLVWRTAVLPIPGSRPITVGLSSDTHGCTTLSAAMFGCAPETVDQSMMNDSLCELVNMTAGLLKSLMALDQALGLPKIVDGGDGVPAVPPTDGQHAVVLRAQQVGLVLWIIEGIA
ncbi:chemotaxis protein CheX [Anaeromyxobacter paludicola]|uniref:chemotaxis protein CheX n=1 Tax=Anaeromyxobacter paludicola TaxID=2918171 RepID=UPI0020BF4581|nr:chemotaxis protein CheX [Anaeromyxobacter paludicola]